MDDGKTRKCASGRFEIANSQSLNANSAKSEPKSACGSLQPKSCLSAYGLNPAILEKVRFAQHSSRSADRFTIPKAAICSAQTECALGRQADIDRAAQAAENMTTVRQNFQKSPVPR